ncbi:MAG: hypothetical protein AAFO91_05560 [Bacteroidota bacterium]
MMNRGESFFKTEIFHAGKIRSLQFAINYKQRKLTYCGLPSGFPFRGFVRKSDDENSEILLKRDYKIYQLQTGQYYKEDLGIFSYEQFATTGISMGDVICPLKIIEMFKDEIGGAFPLQQLSYRQRYGVYPKYEEHLNLMTHNLKRLQRDYRSLLRSREDGLFDVIGWLLLQRKRESGKKKCVSEKFYQMLFTQLKDSSIESKGEKICEFERTLNKYEDVLNKSTLLPVW